MDGVGKKLAWRITMNTRSSYINECTFFKNVTKTSKTDELGRDRTYNLLIMVIVVRRAAITPLAISFISNHVLNKRRIDHNSPLRCGEEAQNLILIY